MKKKFNIILDNLGFIFITLWLSIYLYLAYGTKQLNKSGISWHINSSNINKDALNYISRNVIDTIKSSPLYDKHIQFDLFVVNNNLLYSILVPYDIFYRGKTFGVTYPIINRVFIRSANISKNRCYSSSDHIENNDAVVAHELVHVLQNHKYSPITLFLKTPKWVLEGYPTYVTRSMYIGKTTPVNLLKLKQTNNLDKSSSKHISQHYQLYALMVKYAIEEMHKSVDELHEGKVLDTEVLNKLYQKYHIKAN